MIRGNQVMTAVEQNTLTRGGVGMKAFDLERACPGFTLFAPLFVESRTVYLIDLQGKVVHTWKMPYSPGLSGYLTERATLYYNGRYPEDNFLSRFPFKGGVALEADWSGKVLWEVRHPGQHHDGVLLRNGNVLLDCMGEVPDEIAQRVKGGMDEAEMRSGQYLSQPKAEAGKMYSSYFAELTPAGKTVWEWRTWDHLDPVADSIAEVQAPRTMWHQGNGLKELPDGDILASFRPTSTVVRISRRPAKSYGSLARPRCPASMRQLLCRTATSSYLITELIVSMTRCRIQGSSRSIQRQTRSCGSTRTARPGIFSRPAWAMANACQTAIRSSPNLPSAASSK